MFKSRQNNFRKILIATMFCVPLILNAQTIKLKGDGMTLKSAFELIEKQSGMSVDYDNQVVNVNRVVNVNGASGTVEQTLRKLLAGTGYTYEIKGKHILITKNNATVKQGKNRTSGKTIKVTGKVVDSSGEPIVGATVRQQDSNEHMTVTDIDGNFSMNADKGSNILISYIGFDTQTVRAGENLNIHLDENSNNLNEVVVVGYGTQKKANLTGSVSQVRMDDVLGDRPITSASAALQGAMPGLTIGGGTGPGTSKSLNIRGTLSINGGSPLVLIDNAEGDISTLNPEDIESVTVLKDAASTAIYGARAAGGVVLITLKHPKSNETFRANYNFSLGWETALNTLKQSSLLGFIDAYLEAGYSNSYWAGNGDVSTWREYLIQYQQDPSSLNTVGDGIYKDSDGKIYYLSEKDLFKNLMTTGATMNHNLTVSGGSERIRYRASGSYTRENGPLETNKDMFRRKTFSGYVSADITKWFTQDVTFYYTNSERTSPVSVGNMSNFYTTRLINYCPEGLIPGSILGIDEDIPSQSPLNMVKYAPVSHLENANPRISLKSVFKLLPGWTVSLEYTYDRKENHYHFYSGRFLFADLSLNTHYSTEEGQDYYRLYDETTKYNAFNVYTNYEHRWGKHDFKAMAGFNQEKSYYRYFYSNVLAQAVPSVPSLAGGTGERTSTDTYSEYAIRGGFARLNYSYMDRYLLELNGRYDGSSKFPKNDRFGFFPSVSAGWRLGQESFMDWSRSWLDDFKVRISYGVVGNQRISPYQYTPTMSVHTDGTYVLDDGGKTTYITSPGLVSSSFTWEKVKTLNIGFDFYAFKNRLTTTFEWYSRKTTGMLSAGIEIPDVVGTDAPLQNIADMRGNGWELNVTWQDKIGPVDYRIGFNLYDGQSKITKYNNESGLISDYYVGRKLGEIWGYEADGYYSIDDFVLEDAKVGVWTLKDGVTKLQGYNPQPGDVKFKDQDGDGIITAGENTISNPGDRKIIGNNASRYQFGANLGASYKGLSIDVILQGVGKRDYWLSGAAVFPFGGAGAGDAVFQPLYYNQTDYWRAKSYDPTSEDFMVAVDPNCKMFRIYDQGNNVGSNTRVSDKYLQNAAYLRVKNVTISYNIPRKWLKNILIQDAKIYLSVENLATLSHLPKGYDPEGFAPSSTVNILSNPISWNYPYYRTWSFGASITF